MRYTPENITKLEPDEIFVFGSNLEGMHYGGAARVAHERFGAVMGQGVGIQGQSYAIPTMQGGVDTIRPYVDDFLDLAYEWDQNTFLVTRIGCGIAGFSDEEIAPLFDRALDLYNVVLPKSFVDILVRRRKAAGRPLPPGFQP
jgi:prophage PRU01, putative transcriptional regulator